MSVQSVDQVEYLFKTSNVVMWAEEVASEAGIPIVQTLHDFKPICPAQGLEDRGVSDFAPVDLGAGVVGRGDVQRVVDDDHR